MPPSRRRSLFATGSGTLAVRAALVSVYTATPSWWAFNTPSSNNNSVGNDLTSEGRMYCDRLASCSTPDPCRISLLQLHGPGQTLSLQSCDKMSLSEMVDPEPPWTLLTLRARLMQVLHICNVVLSSPLN